MLVFAPRFLDVGFLSLLGAEFPLDDGLEVFLVMHLLEAEGRGLPFEIGPDLLGELEMVSSLFIGLLPERVQGISQFPVIGRTLARRIPEIRHRASISSPTRIIAKLQRKFLTQFHLYPGLSWPA
jgi:hypothetical protein